MAETKEITKLWVVTDSETPYDNIGDIDGGGFDETWLKKHIRSHGVAGLLQQIAWMNYQIFDALREVNAEDSGQDCVKQNPNPQTNPDETGNS